jgi:hypothetical protein
MAGSVPRTSASNEKDVSMTEIVTTTMQETGEQFTSRPHAVSKCSNCTSINFLLELF